MIELNYHHLYYFREVARAGSIAKARETLLLAQPTISAQLKELEAQLGRPLFERRRQRLHLTDEGRFVLDYADRIFDLGRELLDSLKDRPVGGPPRLQLGVVTGTPPSLTQSLLELIPQAHVTVREDDLGDLEEALADHRLDLVLSDAPGRAELESRSVGRARFVLAARRPGLPLILPAEPRQLRDRLVQELGAGPVAAEVQSLELARRLALAGRGAAPVRVGEPLEGLRVVRRLNASEPVYLVTRRRRWANPLTEIVLRRFRPA